MAGSDAPRRWPPALLIPILGLALACRWLAFTGLIGSDDLKYIAAADALLQGRVDVHDMTHFRLAIIGPTAAARWLFGAGEWPLLVLPVLAACGRVLCAYAAGALLAGRRIGLLAAATLAVLPLECRLATTLLPEAFGPFLGEAGLVLALWATHRQRRPGCLLAAGALSALASWVRLEGLLLVLPVLVVCAGRGGWRALGAGLTGAIGVLLADPLLAALRCGQPWVRWALTAGEGGDHVRTLEVVGPGEYLMRFPELVGVKSYLTLGLPTLLGLLLLMGCALGRPGRIRTTSRWVMGWYLLLVSAVALAVRPVWPLMPLFLPIPRYLSAASLPLSIGLALGLVGARRAWRRTWSLRGGLAMGLVYLPIMALSRGHIDLFLDPVPAPAVPCWPMTGLVMGALAVALALLSLGWRPAWIWLLAVGLPLCGATAAVARPGSLNERQLLAALAGGMADTGPIHTDRRSRATLLVLAPRLEPRLQGLEALAGARGSGWIFLNEARLRLLAAGGHGERVPLGTAGVEPVRRFGAGDGTGAWLLRFGGGPPR